MFNKKGVNYKKINETSKNYTIKEFNKQYRTELTEGMDIDEVTDYLDKSGLSYVYVSLRGEDVLSAYRDFYEETEHESDLVCIEGLYLALH